MTPIVLTLPLATVSLANEHTHWRTRSTRVKAQRPLVIACLRATGQRAELPCVVVLTRTAPRQLDDDNAVSACKGVRDSVAQFIGVDDRDPRVTWHVAQAKGKVSVRIEIRARDARDDVYDRARADVLGGAA